MDVSVSASSAPSRRQGRYVLGERLGSGGMAEVYAGHVIGSHGFTKPVAIKRILPELAHDQVFVERLIEEAKLLVGMQHGNIVSVLDLARDGEDVFLVMEYVDGPSLAQLLKSRGPRRLSLGVAAYIVQAAAAGLEFAHARPGGAVIHADVSPSNLLLTLSGEVRVADFGIARREGFGAGIVEGKWAYMAPEQARGEPLTPRSDVFALGVVLYELITGCHPLGHRITRGERASGPISIRPPSALNPAVPAGLDAICMRALADEPQDRYTRMQRLVDALADERFTHQWREAASDLAVAIRELAPSSSGKECRTEVTGRPLTIATHSLLGRCSAEVIPSTPPVAHVQSQPRVAAEVESPPRFAQGTASSPMRPPTAVESRDAIAPVSVSEPIMPARASEPTMLISIGAPTNHVAYAVLGVAALVGALAAIAIELVPSRASDRLDAIARAPDPIADPSSEVAPPAPPPPQVTVPAPAPVTHPPPAPALSPPTFEPAPSAPTVAGPAPSAPTFAEPPPPTAEVAEAPPPRAKRPVRANKRSPATATLRVNQLDDDQGWAYASIDGKRHDLPAKIKLAPGRYTVKLASPNRGLTRACSVALGADDVATLEVDLEEGVCDVSK